MKIAIIGTRGIPNFYGGFEQFAEHLSEYLVKEDHDVTVYNSHSHPYKAKEWKGVHILHQYDPEDRLGTIGQFIYDLNCIVHSRTQGYDIILQLGYTSNSVWGWLLPKRPVIVTNMDGMEWKRTKYSPNVRRYLEYAEKLAVRYSDYLISDSIGIQKYLSEKYIVDSEYIPYGADLFEKPDFEGLKAFELEAFQYNMLIARLEPENNIEIILSAVSKSVDQQKFLVIGNHQTKYGRFLKERFKRVQKIHFLGPIYDIQKLNNLRFYSRLYFHGHTVGGTNPSLLEAMASGALVCAHDNIFNRSILHGNGNYFKTEEDILSLLSTLDKMDPEQQIKIRNNLEKISSIYSWENINRRYMDFMISAAKGKNGKGWTISNIPFSARGVLKASGTKRKNVFK
jgi:glycosyltransferase involved in cell wall biosynthesis